MHMRRLPVLLATAVLTLAPQANAGPKFLHDVLNFFDGVEAPKPDPSGKSICLAGMRYVLSSDGELVLNAEQWAYLKDNGVHTLDQSFAEGPVVFDNAGFLAALNDREKMIKALTGPTLDGENVSAMIPEGSLKQGLRKVLDSGDASIPLDWEGPDFYIEAPKLVIAQTVEQFLLDALEGLPVTLDYADGANGGFVVRPVQISAAR